VRWKKLLWIPRPFSPSRSLLNCLSSILSSEIDADRLDYLQRDSLHTGVTIGLDLRHLFASVQLKWHKEAERFYVQVQENAIGVIEQILIARKHMFDQVYQHRVTVAFDNLLEKALHFWMKKTQKKAPTRFQEFLELHDESVQAALWGLLQESLKKRADKPTESVTALQMFLTRTPPLRVGANTQIIEEKSDMLEISRKEFFKSNRDAKDSSHDVLFVLSAEGLRPVRKCSEVVKSSAWRGQTIVRIPVYDVPTSAQLRHLVNKLSAYETESMERKPTPTKRIQKRADIKRLSPGRKSANARPQKAKS
jgi:HD superfamily phosphohydrolase